MQLLIGFGNSNLPCPDTPGKDGLFNRLKSGAKRFPLISHCCSAKTATATQQSFPQCSAIGAWLCPGNHLAKASAIMAALWLPSDP
jgi:hypothetical protein